MECVEAKYEVGEFSKKYHGYLYKFRSIRVLNLYDLAIPERARKTLLIRNRTVLKYNVKNKVKVSTLLIGDNVWPEVFFARMDSVLLSERRIIP